MTTVAPVAIPAYSAEPRMDRSGAVLYRHYRITAHAIERYIERIGGDVGNLIADLDSSNVLFAGDKRLPGDVRGPVAKCDREGGWTLTNGSAVFFIKPVAQRHAIVTTIRTEEHQQKTTNKSIRGKK